MKRNSLLLIAASLTPALVFGQSYYDDDIYYSPSKDKKTEVANVVTQNTKTTNFDEPVYQVYTSCPRNVDEYNRRGIYAKTDTIASDSIASDNDVFQYTERMERFDNPTIIISSGDSRLKELYYADDVNIYIGTPSTYWGFGAFSSWWPSYYGDYWYGLDYYSPWSWSWYGHNPYWGWYDPFWGPSYCHHYGWGWGHDWGWGHSWGHPYGGGWRHDYTDGGRRPIGVSPNGRRPALSSGTRFNGGDTYRTTGRRPSSSTYTPSRQTINNRPTNSTYNGYRGGSTYHSNNQSTIGRRPSSSNYDRNSSRTTEHNSYSPSSTSRNNSSSNGFRGGSSSGSSFGGGRSSGSFGGGHSGGSFGGGSRGGRR